VAKTPDTIQVWVENDRLWGSRPYKERSADDAIPRFDFTVPVREGNPDTADIVVEVTEFGDGEIEYEVKCLCHACHMLDNGDLPDEFFRPNVYGVPTPGSYYLKAWYERYPATVNGPEEWDAGWELAPESSPADEPHI
jgi:hypothetical protein